MQDVSLGGAMERKTRVQEGTLLMGGELMRDRAGPLMVRTSAVHPVCLAGAPGYELVPDGTVELAGAGLLAGAYGQMGEIGRSAN